MGLLEYNLILISLVLLWTLWQLKSYHRALKKAKDVAVTLHKSFNEDLKKYGVEEEVRRDIEEIEKIASIYKTFGEIEEKLKNFRKNNNIEQGEENEQ